MRIDSSESHHRRGGRTRRAGDAFSSIPLPLGRYRRLDSREQHDNVLRLDRSLGTFIDSLFELRDSSTIVFALTADHGVTPFPELAVPRAGREPPRYDVGTSPRTLRGMLQGARVDEDAVEFDSTLGIVDRTAFALTRAHADEAR